MARLSLKQELVEIEEITDINGCFLLRASSHVILESTIPIKIHDDILWEIGILRDTFQQFVEGIEHGNLGEIMLEGDKGFIFMYRLEGDFVLLALAPKTINIGYMRLAMIDIIPTLNRKIRDAGEESIQKIEAECV